MSYDFCYLKPSENWMERTKEFSSHFIITAAKLSFDSLEWSVVVTQKSMFAHCELQVKDSAN